MNLSLAIGALATVLCNATLSAHPGHTDPHRTEPSRPAIVVVEYSDFHCKPCQEVSGLLESLVSAKKLPLQVIFKHAPAHPDALVAHEAALAAGQQGKFWEMHDLLFQKPQAKHSDLLAMAKSLRLDVRRFETALEERTFRNEVMMNITEARGMGVKVTPTIFLNGQKLEGIEQIKSFVDMVLNPPQDTSDPNKIYEFDLADSPATGPADAPVTIVEFSDFRCGFCGHHSRTITELVAAYPGKIRRVFKHFPLQVTEEGMLPHQGAMAAMAQGKFWEMYQALMRTPLTGPDDLTARATAIGLDMDRFHRDLTAAPIQALLQRDVNEGDRHGIRMTPTTFINGRMHSGRQTLDYLKVQVEQILNPGAIAVATTSSTVPTLGPQDSNASIEFFADLSDPRCGSIAQALMTFHRDKPDVRIEFKHYPAGGDANALRAHQAAVAAHAQGKFWEMAATIIAAAKTPDTTELLQFASQLQLNPERFRESLSAPDTQKHIEADIAQGNERGLNGQPVLFLNGSRYEGNTTPTTDQLVALLGGDSCCTKRSAGPADTAAPTTADIDIFGAE